MPHSFETQPIQVERFYTGVISNRNKLAIPIRLMGRRIIELYDAILSGSNAEISVRSTLQRACGYIPYNTANIGGIPQKFYAFQPVSVGAIFPIVDTSTAVFYVPPGNGVQTVATKTQGKQSSFFGLGNYLYIGNPEFSQKWDGGSPQGLTKWGISIGSVNNAIGPNAPGTAADVAAPGGVAWTNPNNIKVSDGAFATVSLNPSANPASQGPLNCGSGSSTGSGPAWVNPGNVAISGGNTQVSVVASGGTSQNLNVTNFGFSIPSNATIVGVAFSVTESTTLANSIKDNNILALKSGSPVGTNQALAGNWSTSGNTVNYGGSSNLWGAAWTPADINSNNFGIQISVINNAVQSSIAVVVAFVTATVYYTAPSGSAVVSDLLQGTAFAFAIPGTNTVSGILVEVQGFQTQNPSTSLTATMLKNGNAIGVAKSSALPGSNAFVSYGGSGDLWGATWTPNDVNQTTFGVSLQAASSFAGNTSWSIDFVRITIFGTGGPTVTLVAGTNTATQGFQYLFAFGNSNDNNISNPSPASASIKPVAQGVQISLTASTDPQVNQIRVFRTTDTGTGAVFFELPTSPYPNTTANVTDNAADTALQVTQAVVVGSLAFSPPPAGLVNIEWYAGRLWGNVGNLLYFSAGPDNFPMGKGTSNWPPGNVFELPTTIVKNVALNGGNGMLAVTLDGIHIVQGISNPGFTVNKWLSDVGARQQNAVDTDGSNIFIYTSDNQFLRISAQGIEELSQNVSDQTDALDATKVYVTQHRSGSQDSRVFLADGSSKIYPYNLMMGAWEPVKTPVDGGGVGALGSIEIKPGTFKLLKGAISSGQPILQRDLNTFTDNGFKYPWNAIFGNIPLTDPTQLANVESIVVRQTLAGSMASVGILPNDTAGQFLPITISQPEPPEGNITPVGYQARKFYLGNSTAWSQMTHLQVQFSFPAEAAQNEILSWGIFPNQSADEQVGKIPEIQGR